MTINPGMLIFCLLDSAIAFLLVFFVSRAKFGGEKSMLARVISAILGTLVFIVHFGVLIWYWGLILYPFLTILFEYIENSEAKRAIIYGWGMFPIVFCLLRYRKARCDALMKHYDGKKHIGIIKLLFTPLALFVLEQWLFGKLGWTDSIW